LFDRGNQRSVPIALFVVVALLVAGRIASSAYAAREEPPIATGLVRWVSPEVAGELSQRTGKPLLIDFTAEWCAPCHQLDAEVFEDGKLAAEVNRRFIPVRIVDRQREDGANPPLVAQLEKAYSVRGFPTVVVADASGEKGRMEGFSGRAQFEKMIEQVR
jgi:thiol:disulfide interchange protein